jgi:1-acyl-sn-glycerol-3-phosphate acyltransferase
MASGQPITPAHIAYRLTHDNDPRTTVANDVCYWGDVSMLRHIFRLLWLRGIEIEVCFAESPIVFSESPAQRKRAAVEAREAVLQLGPPAIS